MPYAMCPICGAVSHLNVGGDIAGWFAERYPGLDLGALVPEPCWYCFGELAIGDQVVTRRLSNDNLTIEPGQRGSVEAIRANPEFGKLYVVQLESGKTLTSPRGAIRKRRSSEE